MNREACPTVTRASRVLVLSLATLAAACSSAAQGRPDPGGPSTAGTVRPAEFVLESRYPGPVNVYVVTQGVHRRLGMVTAFRVVRLAVPAELVGRGRIVRLLARPVGGRNEVTTEAFDVERGDRVHWTLLWPLEASVATLRVALGS